MERDIKAIDLDIIDLGAASVETQGDVGAPHEPEGRQPGAGLCDA
jgi:hypothetical protein